MTISFNTILSSLDTPNSLLPFFVKDAFDNTGRTIMAHREGGRHEARERFIEETGTSIFWIGGIPAVRAISNKLFKNKFDTDIHFKRINTKGVQNYFAEDVLEDNEAKFSMQNLEGIELGGEKLKSVKDKLKKAGYKPNVSLGKYKNFHMGTSIAAVAINFFMLTYALPKSNQWLSKHIIFNETKQNKVENPIKTKPKTQPWFKKSFDKNKNTETNHFGSLKELFDFKSLFNFTQLSEGAQLNPTNSMLLLDYGISGSRVTFLPRDNNERIENAVKEAGIILFFYQAAEYIKKGFSYVANKFGNVPIDLDYKVIGDKDFKEKLSSSSDKEDLLKFVDEEKNEINIIKFIDKELAKAPKDAHMKKEEVLNNNFTLKMAHKQGSLDIEYDESLGKWIRHSKKYIETDKIVALNENMRNFMDKAFGKDTKIIPSDKVNSAIAKTKGLKAFSVLGNIAICCVSLSFLLPKLQYFIREKRTKTKTAPGIKVYKDMADKKFQFTA